MTFMPFLFTPRKTPEQKDKEAQEDIGADLQKFLERMTPEERKRFWQEHDKETRKQR